MASGDKVDLIHHLADSYELEFFTTTINIKDYINWEVAGIDLTPTKHVLFMWLAAVLLITVMVSITRRDHIVPRGMRNFFETLAVFIKEFVAEPYLKEDTNRYLPFLWTLFFWIWFCNLLGMIPFGATATGNIMVTASLAIIVLITCKVSALLRHGPVGYLHALVPHVPLWLWPMMFCIEIVGWFAKAFALAIRLFANMVAGHAIIIGFLGMIFTFKSYAVGGMAVGAAVAISCLELFVAILQAFVFTFLTSVFLGLMLHPDH